jgi:hypothetical protein
VARTAALGAKPEADDGTRPIFGVEMKRLARIEVLEAKPITIGNPTERVSRNRVHA